MAYLRLDAATSSRGLNLPQPHRRLRGTFSLRLTSMIDMFTILLVFLLKSFSTEGDILTVAKDLRLPESTANKPPQTASIIAVTPEWILLDGNRIVRTQEVLENRGAIVQPLREELSRLRKLTETIASISQGMEFTGNIVIQGDKSIPFAVLKKIMYTCGSVGYNNMLLAVTRKE
ncbi:MAG: biopolymer transporter ExbD [candidate division KSB1 bacterium]|nr:biopolymer transporter ExbD [candidate division KSB1 bacterium]